MLVAAAAPLRAGRRGRRRAERAAVLHPARHPRAGRRARAPRAPRAVAGRLPRAPRPGRLVDREPARAAALPRAASTSRCPGRPAPSCGELGVDRPRIAVVHNGTDPVVPIGAGKAAAPTIVRRRPAGAAQAGRARDRRGARAARGVPRTCGCAWSAAAGGRPTLHEYAAARGAGDTVVFEGHVDEDAQARDLRARLGAGAALAQGGLGAGRRRGRHAPAPRRSPTASAGGTRESIVDGRSGLLVDDQQDFVRSDPRRCSPTTRAGSGSATGAAVMSHQFTWEQRPGVVRRGGRHRAGRRARRQRRTSSEQ